MQSQRSPSAPATLRQQLAQPTTYAPESLAADLPPPSITDGWKLVTSNKPGDNFGKQFYLCKETDQWICWKEEWDSNLSDAQRGKIIFKSQKYLQQLAALGKKYNQSL